MPRGCKINNPKVNIPVKAYLHCSATPNFNKTHSSFDKYGRDDIEVWHKQRGWSGCGYHIVIRRTGVIEHGRDIDTVPAHAKGYNTNTLAVCYIGSGHPTAQQLKSLLDIYLWAYARFGIDFDAWYGHYEVDPINKPDCPGFDMIVFRKLLYYHHTLLIGSK